MEKLYQLSQRQEDRLDCIVLDTPPANHAVDFMDAPVRILDALSNDATRWLLEPLSAENSRGFGRRLFDVGSGLFVRTISRLTGTDMLLQLSELLQGFQAMLEGFRQRAEAVQALLRAEDTGFLVVAYPGAGGVREASAFVERLRGRRARLLGIVLNRGHLPVQFSSLDVSSLSAELAPDQVESLVGLARREVEGHQAERDRAARLSAELELPVWLVPELESDVHDLQGLEALREALRHAPV